MVTEVNFFLNCLPYEQYCRTADTVIHNVSGLLENLLHQILIINTPINISIDTKVSIQMGHVMFESIRATHLAGNVFIREPDNKTILRCIILVFILYRQPEAGIVVSLALTTPLKLHLVALEVLLVLHYFHKTLQKQESIYDSLLF